MKQQRHIWIAAMALFLTVSMLITAGITPSVAAPAADKLTDEQSRSETEITLKNGQRTGVTWSQIVIKGDTYATDATVNVADFSLSNTHLSVEVLTGGQYMVSSKTLDKAAAAYNAAHPGQTVLAAVNGDLWMTKVHSSAAVTTQTLKVPRGVLIIDGEIWASQQIDNENAGATNNEKGTPAGNKAAFGVTSQNQPLVGSPDIKVSMKVNGQTIAADGLNRLPALNSLIVFNHRVNSSNYVLNDAYEVELEVLGSSAFTAGGTLQAEVKRIYPAGSTERPAIGEKSIILTARGTRIKDLKNNLEVGDMVSFSTTMTDRMGRTELWQDVQEAIGGHMQPIVDGKLAVANGDKTYYPTAFVGYRDDGSVALVTVTSNADSSRKAIRFADGYKFCTEMGYNSVFYLDGGGSTTFVSMDLEKGSYTVRNKCSDGSARSVINGIAVVWNDKPVCEQQGSLDYIKVPVDLSAIPGTYLDGALLAELVASPVNVTLGYDAAEQAFRMTTDKATNDPYASLDFSSLQRVSADEYKYLVFKVKTNAKSASTFMLFYAAGSDNGAAAGRTKSFQVKPGMDEWQYITVDMSKLANWKGNINNIRLDIFDSVNSKANTSMYIGAIVLCKNSIEAEMVAEGWTPDGAVTDYLAYLESLKPKPETQPETEAPTEPETPAVTSPETQPDTTAPETQPDTTVAPTPDTAETATSDLISEPEPSGCSAMVGGGVAVLLGLMAAAVALKRRK